mgnify:CR=1 FL=1
MRPGRHDLARDVARVLARKAITDCRNLAGGKGDVRYPVEPLRRIDDLAALENQIVHEPRSLPETINRATITPFERKRRLSSLVWQ